MRIILELAKLNIKHKGLIEVLLPESKSSPLWKFYNIVFSGKVIKEEDAMKLIYGRNNISSFLILKSKFKEILINVSLLHNSYYDTINSRINESINQFRWTIVSKILLSNRNTSLSILLAERALSKAIKFHSTDNVLILLRILIRHYGTSEFNRTKFRKYMNLEKVYSKINFWEVKAENYFIELQRIQLNSHSVPSESMKLTAMKYANELESIRDIETYSFLVNRYKVKVIHLEYEKNYDALLKLSNITLKELSVDEYKSKVNLQNINIRRAWALIQLERFDEAIAISERDMKIIPSGSLGWYFIGHYKLKAHLYKGDYKNAFHLIRILIDNHQFTKLGENYREMFYCYLGYMHIIMNSGLINDRERIQKSLPEFKIGKFLNNIPVFSKDKRGINVSILLMHVAILLQRKHYDKIIDRIDSLNQYAYKYLRKDDTFRSNCMIKMVIQMAKADFNPIRTERYTRDLLKQLEQVKLAGSGENIETEIIPYEVLWAIMKKALQ